MLIHSQWAIPTRHAPPPPLSDETDLKLAPGRGNQAPHHWSDIPRNREPHLASPRAAQTAGPGLEEQAGVELGVQGARESGPLPQWR